MINNATSPEIYNIKKRYYQQKLLWTASVHLLINKEEVDTIDGIESSTS